MESVLAQFLARLQYCVERKNYFTNGSRLIMHNSIEINLALSSPSPKARRHRLQYKQLKDAEASLKSQEHTRCIECLASLTASKRFEGMGPELGLYTLQVFREANKVAITLADKLRSESVLGSRDVDKFESVQLGLLMKEFWLMQKFDPKKYQEIYEKLTELIKWISSKLKFNKF